VKFSIDVFHPSAWRTVQELGHVLNYVSINERLPTVFKPVLPPPYMNGGPVEFLPWVIECPDAALAAGRANGLWRGVAGGSALAAREPLDAGWNRKSLVHWKSPAAKRSAFSVLGET
jgi:hypothetical protein